MNDSVLEREFTIDAFHRGGFHLVQPKGRGHRAGIDAMLLAAALPDGFCGQVADLGSGAGAAGFAVACRCRQSRIILVEREKEMVDCARRSIALPQNAALEERITIIEADVMARADARELAGLAPNSFDAVIMNPPFNSSSDRATPDTLKRQAHVMSVSLLERWLRTAASIAKPGARLALIARPLWLSAVLDAVEGRFGDVRVVPIYPRSERAAIRFVMHARKGSRAPFSIEPGVVLRNAEGAQTERAEALSNGRVSLWENN